MTRREFLAILAALGIAAACDPVTITRRLLMAGGSGGSGFAAPWWQGRDLWIYGHSYTVDPGLRCTTGQEFFHLLDSDLSLGSVTTYGVSSSRLEQVFFDVLGSTSGSVSGSTWDASRTGVVVVDCEVNDAYNFDGASTAQALTTQEVTNYGDALRAILAVLASSSRVEQTAGTTSGTWSTNTDSRFSGGSNIETTQQNAYIDIPVTVGASGVIWVISYLLSSFSGSGLIGAQDISVDGVVQLSLPAVTSGFDRIKSGRGPQTLDFGVRPIKVSGITPGARTIRIKKTDAAAGKVYADCILVQGDTPPVVLVAKDPVPNPASSATSPTSASSPDSNRTQIIANLPLLDTEIESVCSEFANVTAVPSSIDAAGLSAIDALHPNDLGMQQLAGALSPALRASAH